MGFNSGFKGLNCKYFLEYSSSNGKMNYPIFFIIDKILQLLLSCVTVLPSSCLAINMTYYLSLCPAVLSVNGRGDSKSNMGVVIYFDDPFLVSKSSSLISSTCINQPSWMVPFIP